VAENATEQTTEKKTNQSKAKTASKPLASA